MAKTALIIVDMVRDFTDPEGLVFYPENQKILPRIKKVLDESRKHELLIVFLQHCNRKDKVDKNNVENTLYELLLGEAEAKDTIVKDVVENVDLIPSNVNLSGAEIELIGVDEKEYIMKKIIDKVRRKYDYIIMDCPPSLNMLTINALTAANSVLVPIQCEYYALEGLSQLIHTIELVKERLNKKLVMEGVVFTMYDARTNLSLQVVENVKDNLQQNIYKTIIPRNVRLAEAPSYGQPITLYDTRSAGAEAYRLLAEEVINREGE